MPDKQARPPMIREQQVRRIAALDLGPRDALHTDLAHTAVSARRPGSRAAERTLGCVGTPAAGGACCLLLQQTIPQLMFPISPTERRGARGVIRGCARIRRIPSRGGFAPTGLRAALWLLAFAWEGPAAALLITDSPFAGSGRHTADAARDPFTGCVSPTARHHSGPPVPPTPCGRCLLHTTMICMIDEAALWAVLSSRHSKRHRWRPAPF